MATVRGTAQRSRRLAAAVAALLATAACGTLVLRPDRTLGQLDPATAELITTLSRP